MDTLSREGLAGSLRGKNGVLWAEVVMVACAVLRAEVVVVACVVLRAEVVVVVAWQAAALHSFS